MCATLGFNWPYVHAISGWWLRGIRWIYSSIFTCISAYCGQSAWLATKLRRMPIQEDTQNRLNFNLISDADVQTYARRLPIDHCNCIDGQHGDGDRSCLCSRPAGTTRRFEPSPATLTHDRLTGRIKFSCDKRTAPTYTNCPARFFTWDICRRTYGRRWLVWAA